LLARPTAETKGGMFELMVEGEPNDTVVRWKQVRLDPVEQELPWSAVNPLRYS
jgi:hypothetical protein